MKARISLIIAALAWLSALNPQLSASPLGTTFTYHGQLQQSGSPVNKLCDFQFSLWDASAAGTLIGATQTVNNVSVSNGQFTVQLDFGMGAFLGDARWVDLAVRAPAGSTKSFTSPSPRQPLMPQAIAQRYTLPLKPGTVDLRKYSYSLSEAKLKAQAGTTDTAQHVIVQFESALTRVQSQELDKAGVNLLSFLYANAWLCAAKPSALTGDVIKKFGIAAVAPWLPEYKIDPDVRRGKLPAWAVETNGSLKLLVIFFEDAPQSEMRRILSELTSAFALHRAPNVWAVQMVPGNVELLIALEAVQLTEPGPAPLEPTLDTSRSLLHVDGVQAINTNVLPPHYAGLSGRGVIIAVSEEVDTSHPDFCTYDSMGRPVASRVLTGPSTGSAHGTHVAGIIAGNGWNGDKSGNGGLPYQWRGMAPEATLAGSSGYDDGRVSAVHVSNHSYFISDGNAGAYLSTANGADQDIRGRRGLRYQRPHVWAAANQGISAAAGDEEGYYSIYASGKNSLCVGSVNSLDASLSSFSSLGPTFDGRIKPDVVAGGCRATTVAHRVYIDYIKIINTNTMQVTQQWLFNTAGNAEGWFQTESYNISDVTVSEGLLVFTSKGGYGFVDGLSLPTTTNDVIEMCYRIEDLAPVPGLSVAAAFWWAIEGGDYVDGKIAFNVVLDQPFQIVRVPVGASGIELGPGNSFPEIGPGGWKGTIRRLRIDPVVPQDGIISVLYGGQNYIRWRGTSMAAPAVTGTVALMLERWAQLFGVNLDTAPPLPSTIKAILIQTAQDLQHPVAGPFDPINPDTQTPVLYYAGPDFATGYGLVDAPAAIAFIDRAAVDRLVLESALDIGQRHTYAVSVGTGSNATPPKVTLVWDDVEASASLGDQRVSRLVNDLDLVLIDPLGNYHYPWRLDPPPVADCGGNGPGCGDRDPIGASDITPAYRGEDHRNNVEQVTVDSPIAGIWNVFVTATNLQNVIDGPQSYTLVSGLPLWVHLDLVSDTSWLCTEIEQSGWQQVAFDDTAWTNAVVRTSYPYPPGGYIPGTLGRHIWTPSGGSTAYFRKRFIVSGTPQISQAIVRVDDAYDFYLNGVLVGFKHEVLPAGAQTYDITSFLQRGENVLGIKGWDIYPPERALLFDADARYVDNPLPRLEVTRSNQNVIVSWRIPAEAWNLEYTAALNTPTNTWALIPPPYPSNTTHFVVTESAPRGSRFYRLRNF